MKITSLPHHLKVYVPDSLRPRQATGSMPVARALEALIHAAGGVTESAATRGRFNPDNMLSTCCGAPEGPAEDFCGKCNEGAGWEPDYVVEAVTVYEFYSPTRLYEDKLVWAMLDAGQETVLVARGAQYGENEPRHVRTLLYEKP